MKNAKRLFVSALMVALLGSLPGCIIAERPYPGHPQGYRDPGYRYNDPYRRYDRYDRYERYRDHRHDDYRHRDWDRDRD
jgi:hypothetical protein